MRILHVTDFHFRFFPSPSWFEWMLRQSFDFDAVAFTGDFLELPGPHSAFSLRHQAEVVAEFLRGFPRPLFCCTGNHDFDPGSSRPPAFPLEAARANPNVRMDGCDEVFGGVRFVSFGWGRMPLRPWTPRQTLPVCLLSHAPPAGLHVAQATLGPDLGEENARRVFTALPSGSVFVSGHQHAPRRWYDRIAEAKKFNAYHNFLVVACNPHQGVQKVIEGAPNWTFWNLDRICAEFRLRVPPTQHAQALWFLPPEELRRFVPFTTDALIPPQKFFERFLGTDKLFRHDWKLAGRDAEMEKLRQFTVNPARRVLFVVAKGGDGKSRLLWEYCREMGNSSTEVLCLNPHGRDTPVFAFVGSAKPRVVIVDDAHRTELVTPELLGLIRENPDTKLILAGRPQAQEALLQRLFEQGFQETHVQIAPLPPLPKKALGSLAAEALGPAHAQHAQALAVITKESAFFTAIAGALIQQGKLRWGQWASDQQFRQLVFRAFEEENLRLLPDSDRPLGSNLLRLLALVGPALADAPFFDRAGHCLDAGPLAVEDMLQRLERAELLTGDRKKLRVLPDLFGDLLSASADRGCTEQSPCERGRCVRGARVFDGTRESKRRGCRWAD